MQMAVAMAMFGPTDMVPPNTASVTSMLHDSMLHGSQLTLP